MHLTRFGKIVLLATVLSLFAAASSGNNLLYLIYSMLTATLAVSYVLNWMNLSRFAVQAVLPEQVYQGLEFPLSLILRNKKKLPSFQITLLSAGESRFLSVVPGGQKAAIELPYSFSHRGKNKISDLQLETHFPFGLFRRRKEIPDLTGLAFPKIFEIYGQKMSPAVSEEQVTLPKRGVGEEFHGIREYMPGEDSRLINWKLTAKTGRPLVKEYAQQVGNKITITVDGTPALPTEQRISEAASLSKYFIDSGAELRLVTNEGMLDYGKGLLHLDCVLNKLALLGEGKDIKVTGNPWFRESPPLKWTASKYTLFLAYLTTAAACLSLFLIEELNPVILFPLGLALPLGWIFDARKLYPLPRVLWDMTSGIFLFFFLFVDLRISGVLFAVAHLLLFILLSLLFQPKNERRLKQLFLTNFLVFFLVSGQAVSISYFLFFVLYFYLAALWLILWQDRDPRPVRSLQFRFLRFLGAAVALSTVLAVVAFALTPRIYSPRMQQLLAVSGLSRLRNAASFSGLTENVELGYFGDLKKNSARVMRVRPFGQGQDVAPPPFIRIRAAAFDAFDGRRWRRTGTEFRYRYPDWNRTLPTRSHRAWLRKVRQMVYFPHYDARKPTVIEEYFLNPMTSSLVFGQQGMSAIETDAPSAHFDFTDTVHFPFIHAESTRYKVYYQPEGPPLFQMIENYDRILKEKFLSLPATGEKFSQLAMTVTAPYPDPLEKARKLESYFHNEFFYSLSAPFGRQSLEEFLFRNRTGNCEFFATAMCLLLRSLGIPARLDVGFLSADWNEYGGFFDVRQSDAHAWVEAFIPEHGWMTFDPTPSESIPQGGAFALWGRISRFFSALELRWYRYVVGYDLFTQRNFLYVFFNHFKRYLGKTLLWLGGLAGICLLLYLIKPWRHRRSRTAATLKSGNFYYLILNRLERAGYRRALWQTGQEFADEAVRLNPELQPLAALTNYYYVVRYAGQRLTAKDQEAIRRLIGRIHAILPPARKWAGVRTRRGK
ncbi:MAG: transglutaminaseTgpA domain-containing protein [Candidatus Aminicenantales bacterium]